MEKLLSVDELAAYLGVKKSTVYKRTRVPGAIPCFRIGTLLRFPESQIAKWLETQAAGPVKKGA